MSLANEANQRGLKDFLTLYNTITEFCFDKCVSNFNERSTSTPENSCLNTCTDNYVQYNQRFMFNFVDHQERRKREVETAAAELAAKNAAVESEAQPNTPIENTTAPVKEEMPLGVLSDQDNDNDKSPQTDQGVS